MLKTIPHLFNNFLEVYKYKISVQKEVIHRFKNHILVTWPARTYSFWENGVGLKTKSLLFCLRYDPLKWFYEGKIMYNFHFHKNDVTWPLSANGLLLVDDKITACVKEICLLGVVCKVLNRKTLFGETFCFPEKRLLSILMFYFK